MCVCVCVCVLAVHLLAGTRARTHAHTYVCVCMRSYMFADVFRMHGLIKMCFKMHLRMLVSPDGLDTVIQRIMTRVSPPRLLNLDCASIVYN